MSRIAIGAAAWPTRRQKKIVRLIQHKGKVILQKVVLLGAEDDDDEEEEEDQEQEGARDGARSPVGKQHGLYIVDVGDGVHRPVSTRSALDR